MNNLRLILLLLSILSAPKCLQAQETVDREEDYTSPILKFSYFSFIFDPVSSIQFALEYQLAPLHALQHEIGYVTNLFYRPTSDLGGGENLRGIRLRNEYRYYFNRDKSGVGGFYGATEFLFIYHQSTRSGTLGRDCDGQFGCNYFERVDYGVSKQVYAFHPKLGYQVVFNRLAIDLYSGLGFRHVRVDYKDYPGDSNWGWDDGGSFFSFKKRRGVYNLPSMSFGMKFGYVLKKKTTNNLPYYREDN